MHGWSTFEEREAKAMMNSFIRRIFNKNIVAEIGVFCLCLKMVEKTEPYVGSTEELVQLFWYEEHINENGLRMMRACERESYWDKKMKDRIEKKQQQKTVEE